MKAIAYASFELLSYKDAFNAVNLLGMYSRWKVTLFGNQIVVSGIQVEEGNLSQLEYAFEAYSREVERCCGYKPVLLGSGEYSAQKMTANIYGMTFDNALIVSTQDDFDVYLYPDVYAGKGFVREDRIVELF